MWPDYSDIKSRLGEPLWYDEHGVPRYEPFHPRMCNVYAKHLALMLVECQACEKTFKVAKSLDVFKEYEIGEAGYEILPTAEDVNAFHYGDAPSHDCVGDTMNVITRRILEFWRWDYRPGVQDDWRRCPEYEFEYCLDDEVHKNTLPDTRRSNNISRIISLRDSLGKTLRCEIWHTKLGGIPYVTLLMEEKYFGLSIDLTLESAKELARALVDTADGE